MQEIMIGVAAIWLVGLGMAVIFGKAAMLWYVRETRGFCRRLARWSGQLLGWFVQTALVAVGRAAASTVATGHNFFYSRWPRATLAVYGAILLTMIVMIAFDR